ncbi:MAG: dephospho-CoA kinase [Mariprofundales bacterium]
MPLNTNCMSMVSSAPVISIALTGRIGSGKSTVAKTFCALNIPVLDLDAVGHRLQQQPEVIHLIGMTIGCYTREDWAESCFADSNKMQQLESIMHPLIWQEVCSWRQQQHAPYAIIEASALRSHHPEIDYIITVSASATVRRQRVIARGKQNTADFIRIERLQHPPRGDFAIENNGDHQALCHQVKTLHTTLLQLSNQP